MDGFEDRLELCEPDDDGHDAAVLAAMTAELAELAELAESTGGDVPVNPRQSILCGGCQCHHGSVAQVRVCCTGVHIDPETGQRREGAWLCDWLMQSWVVDGYVTFECHAPAWVTAHGHTCAAGHEHIGLQAAHEMGIVYATEDEAPALAGAGLTVLLMDGHAFLG